MVGFKTEGIILKRRNYSESDRILTIFSKSHGKITVLAKGVRKITSRRAGNIELLNRVQMFLYQGKNFLILTEAIAIDTYPKIKEDLTLSTYAYHVLELVDRLTAENQESSTLYTDLTEVLHRLSVRPRQLLIRAFETKILSLMGFISFRKDLVSSARVSSSNLGTIKNILEDLETKNWDEIEKIQVNKERAMELERILRYHLERVIEGELKSRKFLKEI